MKAHDLILGGALVPGNYVLTTGSATGGGCGAPGALLTNAPTVRGGRGMVGSAGKSVRFVRG